jgi:hypothetical protein
MQITPAGLDLAMHCFQIPGVGVMGASRIAATVTDPAMFDSRRDFAAWLGMTPRQNSTMVVALALANKTARIVWAVMKRGEAYQPKEKFVGRAA